MAAKKTAFQYQVKQSKFGDVDGVFPLLSTSVIQRYPWRDWQLACVCYLVLWTWTVLGIKPQVVHDKWLVGPRLIYKVMLRTQSASMACGEVMLSWNPIPPICDCSKVPKLDAALKVLAACYRVLEAETGNWGDLRRPTKGLGNWVCDMLCGRFKVLRRIFFSHNMFVNCQFQSFKNMHELGKFERVEWWIQGKAKATWDGTILIVLLSLWNRVAQGGYEQAFSFARSNDQFVLSVEWCWASVL